MIVRDATPEDWPAIWAFVAQIVRAGDTFTYDPAMSEQDRSVFMTWSIVPAMAGWVSLLMPIKTGLLMLIAIYAIQFAADRQLASRFQIPDWYLRLRGSLTPVAVLCLALALIHLVRH